MDFGHESMKSCHKPDSFSWCGFTARTIPPIFDAVLRCFEERCRIKSLVQKRL